MVETGDIDIMPTIKSLEETVRKADIQQREGGGNGNNMLTESRLWCHSLPLHLRFPYIIGVSSRARDSSFQASLSLTFPL